MRHCHRDLHVRGHAGLPDQGLQVTLALAAALLLAAGCDRPPSARAAASPPAAPAAAPPIASPRVVPGPPEKVFLRLLGALAEAEVEAPRLAAALRDLAGRSMQISDPLSRLPPHMAPLARKVTLPGAPEKREYQMREALYAPPPFRAAFRVRVPPGARLAFEAASFGPATVAVEILRGGMVQRVLETRPAPRTWTTHEVDLSAHAGTEVKLRLATEGPGPHVFFGAPRLFGRADDAPPSVLLIAIDTLSAEVVGMSGSDRGITPAIDRLAATGTAFPMAMTNANWTRASTLSMFASEYSTALGINVHSWWLDRANRRALYRRFDGMLPDLMKRAGYVSAAIGNNLFILGYHSAGVEMGFEHVADYRTDDRDTADITRAARAFLRRHKDRPFFLFVNFNSPHHPYTPPPRVLKRVDRPGERLHPEHRRYLGEVAFADESTGRLLEVLDETGLRERTLVVLTADHGEGLREDVAYINVAIPRYSRFTHTVNLYDEVMRVPLAFSRPADIPPGRLIQKQVRLIDLAPTILSLVRLPPHPQHRGADLSPLVLGRGDLPERLPAFMEGKKCSALRWKGYKYIRREPGYDVIARRNEGFRRRAVPEELYRVERDPRELSDLAGAAPPALEEMREAHRRWRRHLAEGPRPFVRWFPQPLAGPAPPAPPAPPARTHLAVTGDGRARVVAGSIRARGRITRWRLLESGVDDALWPAAPDRLDFSLAPGRGERRLTLETDPPGATLELDVRVDGAPLTRLLVGPFGLPLLDPPHVLRMPEVGALLAGAAPPRRPGAFGVFLWREGGAAPEPDDVPEPGEGRALESDVERALRDWGYIQKGDKVLK